MSYAIYERSKHVPTFNGVLCEYEGMVYPSPLLEHDTLFFDTVDEAVNYIFGYRERMYQQNEARLKLLIHEVVKIKPREEFYIKLSHKARWQHPDTYIDEVVHTIE